MISQLDGCLPYSFCHPAFFIKQKDIACLAVDSMNYGVSRELVIFYYTISVEGCPAVGPEQNPVVNNVLCNNASL